MQKQLNLIETTIANLRHVSDIPLYRVAPEKFPAHNVISIRGSIEISGNEAVLWEKLAKERALQKIQFANPPLNIVVFHDEGFKEYDLDVEIQQAVVERYGDTETMKFKKIKEITAATLTFKGQYGLLSEANEEINHTVEY